jgi:hypothetical protein
MGFYEREMEELRQKCKEVDSWVHLPKEERLKLQLQIYAHTSKKGNLILSAFAIAAKHGKKVRQDLMRTGLLGDSMIVDMSPEEAAAEKVLCPNMNKDITREECKDRSGNSMHFEECQECEINASTRRLLVQTLEGKSVQ